MESTSANTCNLLACYGHQFGRLPRCTDCEWAEYCREARDPSPLTGPNAGPGGDDLAFEMAVATTVADDEAPASGDDSLPAAALGEILATVCDACHYSPDRIAGVVLRLMGLSLGQIGALTGKSRQAVWKDVGRIEESDPRIGRLLRQRWPIRGSRSSVICDVLRDYARSAGRKPWDARRLLNAALVADYARRRLDAPLTPLMGTSGLYADLARDWGLPSARAARLRILRGLQTPECSQPVTFEHSRDG